MNENYAFFKPYIGEHYEGGICSKKILVVGASVYCTWTDCKYFKQCTDESTMNSAPYDANCQAADYVGKLLSDAPSIESAGGYKVYSKFKNLFAQDVLDNKMSPEEVWSHIAFTEYVQFVLPHPRTLRSNCSERDQKAFIATVKELKPDIVIVWGCVVCDPIREFEADMDYLKSNDWYLGKLREDLTEGKITHTIYSYHPSSSHYYWENEKIKYIKYLRKALDIE